MLRLADIADIIKYVFGSLIILVLVILGIPYLASIGLVGAQDSANLTSSGDALSEALPWFGIIIAGGIIALAIGGRR